ncbi:hypothetical protein FE257_012273 [Aspergillus nanangensis]|uniref:Amidase domain-containing protein n=1 Tax=Aspergillus nanangensis TaxID=2582783 RepID=A0AAD4CGM1_ASPNN|nr:hypothetical protein FE257_012273 [Aspergillus nanangensis]
MGSTAWEIVAQEAQSRLLDSIPPQWRIEKDKYAHLTDVTDVPRTAGILTKEQLNITESTATELSHQLTSQRWTAVEVLEAFAARAAIAHQLVNCLTDWLLEDGLKRAAELDKYMQEHGKPVGPLHGIPVCLKDTYDVKGYATTMGYLSKKDDIVNRDAAVVHALREAGAVFYVRTAMPQTGMALETSSNLWGRTLNPFNIHLGAGGSSGGDGALVALHGSPIAPSTDIGGSIRAPAAFNGLYAIRPTADRIPKGDDVRLFTKVLNAHPVNRYDVTCSPVPWREVSKPEGKLTVGVMKSDGVVMPHPPIIRAIEDTCEKLRQAGHQVIDFTPPFDCWEAAKTTFDLYFPDGAKGTLAMVDASGEPLLPAFANLLEVYNAREQTAAESLKCNVRQREYKTKFVKAWDETASQTSNSRPIDVLICPCAPSTSFPHGFNVYWGYTSLFNMLDYPSTILPVSNFRISEEEDPINTAYHPVTSNPYDQANHELYNPSLFKNQPVTIQVVGRPFDDEELIEATGIIDELLNPAN